MINAVNRELPEKIGEYKVRPYEQAYGEMEEKEIVTRRKMGHMLPGTSKLVSGLEEAIVKSGLKYGMTISFHNCTGNDQEAWYQAAAICTQRGSKY